MQLNEQVVAKLAADLMATGLFASAFEVNKQLADVLKSGSRGSENSENRGSISKMIRGLQVRKGNVLNTLTAEEDEKYVQKTLTTGTTPGSYLVPTIQADAIIEILGKGGVVRASGATYWPMQGIQKMTIPTETAEPTVEYLSQNQAQTPSDPNLGQISLDLKTRRSLIALPNELLKASSPAIDKVITSLLGKAFSKSEDLGFFSGISGGPTAVNVAAGTNNISQAGANLAYADLLNALATFAAAEGENGAWYIHPTIFFKKILGMVDANNRPIVTGLNSLVGGANDGGSAFVGQEAGNAGPVKFLLLGHPVYLSPRIPTHVGSGSASTYILFTNPAYLHIGDSGNVEIAISGERYFDSNQTAIRAVGQHDFGYAPTSAIVLLNDVR